MMNTDRIVGVLSDNAEDWEPRLAALKELQEHIEEGEVPLTTDVLVQLHVPLQKQLTDLRSTIVREACQVLVRFATCTEDGWRALANRVVPDLIEITGSANKVMVQYANECAKTVLEHTHCQRAVAKIVEMSNGSRSKVLRKTCMECVLVVLQHWEYSQLEREIGAIQDVLKHGVSDAANEVRTLARQSFWLFYGHDPKRGHTFLQSMDGRTHKALEDERPPELEGVRSPASKSARGGSGGGAAASRASRRKPPTPRSGAPPSPSHSAHSGAVSPSSSVRSGRSTKSAAPSAAADDDDAADADAAPARVGVGDRVSVSLRSGIMRGTVGYTGQARFAAGWWVGVVLDEPDGKNDGSVKGVTYFEAPANHGIFVRGKQVSKLDESDEDDHDETPRGANGTKDETIAAAAGGVDSRADDESDGASGDDAPVAPAVVVKGVPGGAAGGDAAPLGAEEEEDREDVAEVAQRLISSHRRHIDEILELLREEMGMLSYFERLESNVDAVQVNTYVDSVQQVIAKRSARVKQMQNLLGSVTTR